MNLTNAEIARITAELAREMIPVLKEQLREEILIQVDRQVREMERRQKGEDLRIGAAAGPAPTPRSKMWRQPYRRDAGCDFGTESFD